jgi:hypothetical protein
MATLKKLISFFNVAIESPIQSDLLWHLIIDSLDEDSTPEDEKRDTPNSTLEYLHWLDTMSLDEVNTLLSKLQQVKQRKEQEQVLSPIISEITHILLLRKLKN